MKTIETEAPKSLVEVWEWKSAVSDDIKDMTTQERMAYFHEGLEKAARILGARLEQAPDGTFRTMR